MTRRTASVAVLCAGLFACATSGGKRFEGTQIAIEGSPEFVASAQKTLRTLRNTQVGARIFSRLESANARVRIRYRSDPWGGAHTDPEDRGGSLIFWDPTFELHRFPPEVFLYHELVHAWYNAVGMHEEGPEAEKKVIGLGQYSKNDFTENALREELGIPKRPRWDYPRRYPPEED